MQVPSEDSDEIIDSDSDVLSVVFVPAVRNIKHNHAFVHKTSTQENCKECTLYTK